MTDTTTPKPKRYKSRKVVNAAIAANVTAPPELYRTWPQLADDLGVDVQVVHDQINRLRKKGVIPKAGEQAISVETARQRRAHATRGKRGASVLSEDQQLEKALSGDMDPLERRTTLAQIGRFGQEQNAIRAMEALNRMDEAKDRGIGPPAPMTEADRVKRLSDLMRAVGRVVADKAMEVAFGSDQGSGPTAGGSDLGGCVSEQSGRPAGGSDNDPEPDTHGRVVVAEDATGASAGIGRGTVGEREHSTDNAGDPT